MKLLMTIIKIAYITVQIPYGKGETFIISEIKEVLRQGNTVLILPFRPEKNIFHRDAVELKEYTHKNHFISAKVFSVFIIEFLRHPVRGFKVITKMLGGSGRLKIIFKNITTIPKGFYAASVFRQECVDHIHAHWASTPASVAYIASYLSGIPWSFTAHRWDINENNILKEKVSSASFVRAISLQGAHEIAALTEDTSLHNKINVIHMGVDIPAHRPKRKALRTVFTVMCPANLLPVKGHKYLIEACKIMRDRGLDIRCLLAGDGPQEDELKLLTKSLKLEKNIEFLGRLPHQRLYELYSDAAVDAVVLPSITTTDGEKEGIPVALMEAMAYGIPVIATNTGGIPELCSDAGILVPEKDAVALAGAIEKMSTDELLYEDCRMKGAKRIEEKYSLSANVKRLLSKMQGKERSL